jgi:hypothetical protein
MCFAKHYNGEEAIEAIKSNHTTWYYGCTYPASMAIIATSKYENSILKYP